MGTAQFKMVEELAFLIKDNLSSKDFVISVEEDLVDFLQNDMSSAKVLELEPMNSYHRMLVHRLANIYGLEHKSYGGGRDRHLLLERFQESSIPSVLVSDILRQYDGYKSQMTSTKLLKRKDPSPEMVPFDLNREAMEQVTEPTRVGERLTKKARADPPSTELNAGASLTIGDEASSPLAQITPTSVKNLPSGVLAHSTYDAIKQFSNYATAATQRLSYLAIIYKKKIDQNKKLKADDKQVMGELKAAMVEQATMDEEIAQLKGELAAAKKVVAMVKDAAEKVVAELKGATQRELAKVKVVAAQTLPKTQETAAKEVVENYKASSQFEDDVVDDAIKQAEQTEAGHEEQGVGS
ncbi:uncharacterized protein LOC143862427 [Tasmannia lanceolata]|uniref:uncharacterized protein LOC143862427 n=1 Tax=Tasmannia lanceolata TaxID=3420 RepID=UPI0040647C99